MNKQAILAKKVTMTGVVAVVVGLVFGGIFYFTGGYAESSAKVKADADAALARDQAQMTSLQSQLEKSGNAEKRYVEIKLARTNMDFSANKDALTQWLKVAKFERRFGTRSKLVVSTPKETDKADLSGLDYKITVRPAIVLEADAMSDMHIFSFINDFIKETPGIVVITKLDLQRNGDMTPVVTSQMQTGASPTQVTAKIEFDWVGVDAKDASDTKNAPAEAAAPTQTLEP